MSPSPAPGADLSPLADLLGDEPPASLASLEQSTVDDLVAMVTRAQAAQVTAISAAIDDALRLVPRPLRGVVKRVIGA